MPVHDSPKILTELVESRLGFPIIVLGGSMTMIDDLNLIPLGLQAQATYISANEHGAILRSVDFVVCNDRYHQETQEYMPDRIRKYTKSPIISPRFLGDYRIHNYNKFKVETNSGLNAILVAHLMGGWPIIGCGLSMYTGEGTYWHQPDAVSSGTQRTLGTQMNRARSVKRVVGDHTVRIVSGPLTSLWPTWAPDEEDYSSGTCRKTLNDLRNYRLQRASEWTVTHGGHRLCTVGVDTPFESGQHVWLTPFEASEIRHWVKEAP